VGALCHFIFYKFNSISRPFAVWSQPLACSWRLALPSQRAVQRSETVASHDGAMRPPAHPMQLAPRICHRHAALRSEARPRGGGGLATK
jgi:hypothetical protein